MDGYTGPGTGPDRLATAASSSTMPAALAAALAMSSGSLVDHEDGENSHRPGACEAGSEQDEHQRPRAAEAVEAVPEAEANCDRPRIAGRLAPAWMATRRRR
jgi:hypothetical protein